MSSSLTTRKKLFFACLVTVLVLVLIEIGARIGLSLLTVSPEAKSALTQERERLLQTMQGDLDSAEQGQQLYTRDDQLFWNLRPDLQLIVRNNVYETVGDPVQWNIQTNRDGFRGESLPADRSQASPLVLCLGDSCTFGFRVDQDETYPSQLQAYLRAHGLPQAVVLNCGVPGYSSFQGKRVAREMIPRVRPDFVVVAFGANDLEPAVWSDEQRSEQNAQLQSALSGLRNRLAVGRLFDRLFRSQRQVPNVTSAKKRRVSAEEYEENLRSIITVAQEVGAEVMVQDLIFLAPVYANQIERLVRERNVEHLDGRRLIQQGLEEIQAGTRFQQQRAEMDRFWENEVAKYNCVYYSEQYYQQLFNNVQWRGYLRYLLIEPVHPSPLGHQLISEQIGQWIVDKSSIEKLTGELPAKQDD